MSNTNQLGLPLLQPSQAQKHVTMNEALTRLDGAVQMTLASRTTSVPPTVVPDGICYGVPVGAVNEWSGQDGNIAIGYNNGWDFLAPKRGWRTVILDEGHHAIHDGAGWRAGMMTLSPNNSGVALRVAEIDHELGSGGVSTTTAIIPANSVVIGVTARVITAITGTLSSWALGNPGGVGRYGSGLGIAVGSWARGVLAQPTAFYSPEVMQLDAIGGDFSGGTVRIAVHFMELTVPDL